jgi:hypothetical protein
LKSLFIGWISCDRPGRNTKGDLHGLCPSPSDIIHYSEPRQAKG